MKPIISGIDIDIKQDDIEIVLETSEGKKYIDLSLICHKGCYICTSDIGGMNETQAGIFLTFSGQRTQKI